MTGAERVVGEVAGMPRLRRAVGGERVDGTCDAMKAAEVRMLLFRSLRLSKLSYGR